MLHQTLQKSSTYDGNKHKQPTQKATVSNTSEQSNEVIQQWFPLCVSERYQRETDKHHENTGALTFSLTLNSQTKIKMADCVCRSPLLSFYCVCVCVCGQGNTAGVRSQIKHNPKTTHLPPDETLHTHTHACSSVGACSEITETRHLRARDLRLPPYLFFVSSATNQSL